MKILSIVGARPQFIKLSPFIKILKNHSKNIKHIIVHTGQHYDYNMSKIFFEQLNIPRPNYHLGVGSGTHGYQTAEILRRIEKVFLKEKPDWVLIFGDTNTTLAGALAAAKLHIFIAHIEAGLRSFNKCMPEEINRILADHVANILFCPTENAAKNLQREGFNNIFNNGRLIGNIHKLPSFRKSEAIVFNVGDIMYDAMLICLKIAEEESGILTTLDLLPKTYYLATVHRAENTNNIEQLNSIVEALLEIGKKSPVIWPIHPRTRKLLKDSVFPSRLRLIKPVSYFDMLILEKNAKKILTDSGGVQKEAYWLKVPCITLREETEWVETLKSGLNVIVGTDKKRILKEVYKKGPGFTSNSFHKLYGDGNTAERILNIITKLK